MTQFIIHNARMYRKKKSRKYVAEICYSFQWEPKIKRYYRFICKDVTKVGDAYRDMVAKYSR